ncbi:hypothetical protein C8J46_1096 [Sphingomonas sp. PP-F2F-A104-K0414]|nr:hypothetical protein C8J46_1096 [Sphingomonas sp. PP-F2F-A104-K0414]
MFGEFHRQPSDCSRTKPLHLTTGSKAPSQSGGPQTARGRAARFHLSDIRGVVEVPPSSQAIGTLSALNMICRSWLSQTSLRASDYQSMIALTAFTAAAPMARTFKPPPHPAFPFAPTPDPEQLLPSLSMSARVSRTTSCGPTSSPSMAPRRYLPSSRLPQTTRSSGAPLLEHNADAVTPVMLRYFVMGSLLACAAAGAANATRDAISDPTQIVGFCDF